MSFEQVLDKGYVRLVNHMGSDLTIVNAARVSYAKESTSLSDRDVRLIQFLAREGHTSPFRHVMLQFEVYAPLMVARQWWKYVIGSGHMEGTGDSMEAWNESSRRYITEEPEFYIPHHHEWRSTPENSKQGSGDPLSIEEGTKLTQELLEYIELGVQKYEEALKRGACAEQARLFLPSYGMYIRWYWTASLQSVCHFLNQRLMHDAQKEIQLYAKAILNLCEPLFPHALREMVDLDSITVEEA
ncbi:FAD-dependent thymidylate synthase [Paenibacillus sp. 453mf]|uniref:FAD-dependent thymidylate synthase n=1 Tax=Paenibacillus sp. 453mf TaxID=1761874 RepID=UPI0008F05758|nr:FAD-dependent thymidylate synthase [Paenibacillus sp. 453mf]SFS42230.1 thymidylate synthase (FAD) [Paenibacillus sp. 453mf]